MEINEFGFYPRRYLINRRRSLSISDKLYDDILKLTKNSISVSYFIRLAVKEKMDTFNRV